MVFDRQHGQSAQHNWRFFHLDPSYNQPMTFSTGFVWCVTGWIEEEIHDLPSCGFNGLNRLFWPLPDFQKRQIITEIGAFIKVLKPITRRC